MNRHLIAAVVAMLSTVAFSAERREGFFDGGWRISAGAVWSSPVKADMRFSPSSLRPPSRVFTRTGLSEDEALARAQGGTYDPVTGRTTYPNGAWFAPDEGVDGPDHTWNAHLPVDSYRGDRTFSLGQVEYDGGMVSSYATDDIPGHNASDSSGMFGIDVELSRELYRNEEHKYGLDIAFGVMYFFRNDIFKSDYGYRAGRESWESGGNGFYEGTIAAPDELPDSNDWYWNDDRTYGRGGLDTEFNGGPVFDLSTITAVPHAGVGSAGGRDRFGSICARGDYRELDLELCLRPYYDVKDWLRLYGTIGVVVSHDEFDLDVSMTDNGRHYRHKSDFSQWDVHGIGGLGVMLRYKDFTLAGDFLARFLDDDLTVDDHYVHGTIEHGRWMFKLALGYEF